MKKIIPILMIVCILCSFAACGAQEEAVAIITPEPVSSQTVEQGEQAQVVVPDVAPAEQGAQAADNGEDADGDQDRRSDSGSNATTANTDSSTTSNNDNGADNSADKLTTAMGYIGSSLGALQSAIGAPNSSEYVVSCLEDATMEGLLYYDGFVVWTVQYSDGSEVVKGVS